MSVNLAGLVIGTFTGNNGVGGCSCTGLEVNDLVIGIWSVSSTSWIQPGTHFEAVISVADQIQQLVGNNYSADTFTIVCFRGP